MTSRPIVAFCRDAPMTATDLGRKIASSPLGAPAGAGDTIRRRAVFIVRSILAPVSSVRLVSIRSFRAVYRMVIRDRIATMDGFEGLPHVGRMLMGLGAVLLVLGAFLMLAGRVPHVGKLPGDIVWRHGSFTFYFPIVTCLVLSGLISLVLWLLRK